ncbi:hypothetical protein BC936DRAFT_139747 [Jimgerdemannia flammicorona]|uniref:F-box domain-containing protein n=1 Tax=Jimgerdemannia flammicorona TaxID=994334 RepID=A0A433B9B9_9FUNG|nr:hypothetical protein BC936DRAFT_139747 [Jimgerdemannia flammicorona]
MDKEHTPSLPTELLVAIFTILMPRKFNIAQSCDILSASLVCRQWYTVVCSIVDVTERIRFLITQFRLYNLEDYGRLYNLLMESHRSGVGYERLVKSIRIHAVEISKLDDENQRLCANHIGSMIRLSPNLTELRVEVEKMQPFFSVFLRVNLSNIRRLFIRQNHVSLAVKLVQSMPFLEELDLDHTEMTSDLMNVLNTRLTTLVVRCIDLSQFHRCLVNLSNLRSINIITHMVSYGKLAEAIAKNCPGLQEFTYTIPLMPVDSRGTDSIALNHIIDKCKQLVKLNINNVPRITKKFMFYAMQNALQLHHLSISTTLSSVAADLRMNQSNLQLLILDVGLSNEELLHILTKCPHLHTMQFIQQSPANTNILRNHGFTQCYHGCWKRNHDLNWVSKSHSIPSHLLPK